LKEIAGTYLFGVSKKAYDDYLEYREKKLNGPAVESQTH